MSNISQRTDWQQMKDEVFELIKRLRQKPNELKRGNLFEPGTIINAYRDGDIDLIEAVSEIEKWKERCMIASLKGPKDLVVVMKITIAMAKLDREVKRRGADGLEAFSLLAEDASEDELDNIARILFNLSRSRE